MFIYIGVAQPNDGSHAFFVFWPTRELMSTRYHGITVVLVVLLSADCDDFGHSPGATPSLVPLSGSTYAYTAFDSSGTAVVSGWLVFA